jgi:hypothetical protein
VATKSPALLSWLAVPPGKIAVCVTKATECVAFVTQTAIIALRVQLSHPAWRSEAKPSLGFEEVVARAQTAHLTEAAVLQRVQPWQPLLAADQ